MRITALLLLALPGWAQSIQVTGQGSATGQVVFGPGSAPPVTCGSSANDTTAYVAPNYIDPGMFVPPFVAGGVFQDPQYHCSVTRLSLADVQFTTHSVGPEYSMSAMNQSDELIFLGTSDGFWEIVDKFGNIVVPTSNIHIAGTPGGRWQYTNTYTFLYLKSGGTKNRLAKGVVPTNYNACRPSCTITETILHTFTEYSVMNMGGAEGDLRDDNHVVLDGTCNGATCTNGTAEVFVYTISDDTKHTPLNFGDPANYDNSEMMPGGSDAAVCLHDGPVIPGLVYPGKFLFTNEMAFVRKLTNNCDHDNFFPYNGRRWMVGADGANQFCSANGFYILDIDIGPSSGVGYRCNQFYHSQSMHPSAAQDGSGWISFSMVDYGSLPNTASYPVSGSWNAACNTVTSSWCDHMNEVGIYDLAHDNYYRVAQHRSKPSSSDYGKIPKANMSRDGQYVIYSSDYGAGLGSLFDGWMVNVGNLTAHVPLHFAILSWTASTDSVDGYNIYRGTVSGGPYSTKVNGSLVTLLNYTNQGLAAGTHYCWVVRSSLAGVESANSAEFCGTTGTP